FLASHGPATLRDLAWWSGLTLADAKRGVAALGSTAAHFVVEGAELYDVADADRASSSAAAPALLLPNFDEYIIAYANRSALFDAPELGKKLGDRLYRHFVVVDGVVVGGWRDVAAGGGELRVETIAFSKSARLTSLALRACTKRFIGFRSR